MSNDAKDDPGLSPPAEHAHHLYRWMMDPEDRTIVLMTWENDHWLFWATGTPLSSHSI